jgi:DNA (cytosine-5)-methyltransferase 1
MTIGVVDIFCGIGGFTYGLQQAGLSVVAGIDSDASCEYAYELNNNALFICRNVEKFKGRDIIRLLDGYDVKMLVGCAPCQPFSHHQKDKKNREKHKDWRLLYQYARLIRETKPDVVAMENVPELENERVFADFIKTLEDEHYFVNYQIVSAADYGVPQRRRRLILLASVFKPIKLIEKTHEKYVTVRDTIYGLPEIEAGVKNSDDRLHVANALSEKNLKRIRCSVPGGTWRDWPEELVANCHKGKTGRTYPSVYGRMKWDDLSPTITTQFTCFGTGRFGHPCQDRALTLREGALIQTFPMAYSFVPDDREVLIKIVARQIGNALPPRLAEIIGISIQRHLNNY